MALLMSSRTLPAALEMPCKEADSNTLDACSCSSFAQRALVADDPDALSRLMRASDR